MARFRFSFLSDVTGLYRFRRRGRRPTIATLDRVAEAIVANLPACRENWWVTQGGQHEIGLVNRRVETRRIAVVPVVWTASGENKLRLVSG